MSVQEEAEKLRTLAASRDIPIEMLHKADEDMAALHVKVRDILGSNSQHLGDLDALAHQVKDALETAIGAAKQYEDKLYVASDAHGRG